MSNKSIIGGKLPQSGNNVSHSHRKTKRKWMPNHQKKTMYSQALDRFISLRVSAAGLRDVDRAGGLDGYLLAQPATELEGRLSKLQQQIRAKTANAAG